jgi:hypothetical protein
MQQQATSTYINTIKKVPLARPAPKINSWPGHASFFSAGENRENRAELGG